MTRRLANPRGSPCHRYPAFASFPPTGPALLGARFRAGPGIRVSRSGRSRKNSMMSGPGGIKKPSGAALGRVRRNGFSISYQTRSLPCVELENGPWPFRFSTVRSHWRRIAQLASGIGDHPRTRRVSSWFAFDCQQANNEDTISPRCRAQVWREKALRRLLPLSREGDALPRGFQFYRIATVISDLTAVSVSCDRGENFPGCKPLKMHKTGKSEGAAHSIRERARARAERPTP
jgi:hypothetical protein